MGAAVGRLEHEVERDDEKAGAFVANHEVEPRAGPDLREHEWLHWNRIELGICRCRRAARRRRRCAAQPAGVELQRTAGAPSPLCRITRRAPRPSRFRTREVHGVRSTLNWHRTPGARPRPHSPTAAHGRAAQRPPPSAGGVDAK